MNLPKNDSRMLSPNTLGPMPQQGAQRNCLAGWGILRLSALAIALLLTGCASAKQVPEEPAVRIAKEAVLKELGWKKVRAESYPAPDGGYSVTVWLLPEAPGRFFVVDVSADGRVTAMHPGS
jgi:hypothetical protein